MILPKITLSINPQYVFGADYLSLLDARIKWPPKMLSDGLIRFDTSGISTNNRLTSDIWTLKIIFERFGLLKAIFYTPEIVFRFFAKTVLSVIIRKR